MKASQIVLQRVTITVFSRPNSSPLPHTARSLKGPNHGNSKVGSEVIPNKEHINVQILVLVMQTVQGKGMYARHR